MRFSQLIGVLLLAGLVLSVPLRAQAQESDRKDAARALVETLLTGDVASVYDQFNDQVHAAVTADQLAQAMAGVQQQSGAFQEIVGVREDAAHNAIIVTVNFEQATLDARVVYDADGKVGGLNFVPAATAEATEVPVAPPPSYADPATFTEQDVTVGDYDLPGVLTYPNTTDLVPAVVMLSGSGPNDRDETIGPNKPFRDIAQGLAAQGIATLRFDKRTFAAAAASIDVVSFTVQGEYVDDAIAAIELLRNSEGIDPERVFLLGHSQGGYIAPRVVAVAGDDLAGVIYVAAAATSLPEAVLRQTRYLVEHTPGVTNAQKEAAIAQAQSVIEQIDALTKDSPADEEIFYGYPAYWLDLRDYDPVAVAQTLDLPMLFVQGGRDYQVTVADDLTLWQAALGDRANVTIKEYADLNHLLMTGEGDSVPAEYQVPGNVAQPVIDDMAAWVKAQ